MSIQTVESDIQKMADTFKEYRNTESPFEQMYALRKLSQLAHSIMWDLDKEKDTLKRTITQY